ncbi:3-phenylpropionate/trans-cinnamate dioxygenase ferredoxin reductase subunit [Rhodococcus erythropolis]|uniref:NAD(P)/FAD-dependent oxidoreductase n=1 Tax=Rhodococcus erythropolis TaxID=1833 RepID=UPI002168A23C|nr:FAD-dependent oxidoreductase [Rhodococcus erythropolis]MCS4253055.1 3-phenylpropionate/trans-cinnamate dioxygenase ferredoxin reductase subunit [Rhodococcus erythropolis]MCW2428500.1 3-phenylpropionate/trans-cinnamate dioxygenase ferredoxin reductase subunit [Rhodococcus erythropolis]
MDLTHSDGVVVIGAGHAGVEVVTSLRNDGYTGGITLINGEVHSPYDRPSLSKDALMGSAADSPFFPLRAETFFTSRDITVVHAKIARIQRDTKTVEAEDGRQWSYNHLVLATGGRPRTLSVPGADLEGVAELRSLDDAHSLSRALLSARHVAIIGGGFIGLEVAAAAAAVSSGAEVTLFERSNRLMGRVVTQAISDAAADHHRRSGVKLRFGDDIVSIRGELGKVTAVLTADGEEVPADLVVLGVGMVVNDDLASAAGLPVDRGILTDDRMRSADPNILAVGDCAAWEDQEGHIHRLESIQNASDQARHAAATIIGGSERYTASPWFWSNQGAFKLQIVGLSDGCDRTVVRGDTQRFSVFCFLAGDLIAIESVNDPGTHMMGRRLFERGLAPNAAVLASENYDLRTIAKRELAKVGDSK